MHPISLLLAASAALPPQLPAPAPQTPPAAMATAPRAATAARPLTAVLFDRRTDDELWALGGNWKARFDPQGCTFVPFCGEGAPTNFPLRLELQRATVGGRALDLTPGQLQLEQGTVRVPRAALTERYDTALEHVEQSFVFRSLPTRGELVVELAITSSMAKVATGGGIRFANEHGGLDYRDAFALDADGRRLPLAITLDGDVARITIPAAFVESARLPLVLDPVLASTTAIPLGTSQRLPDVAVLQNPDVSCVVWQRAFSLTDSDVLAEVLTSNLGFVTAAPIAIDVTGESWTEPKVASHGSLRTFLVAAQATVLSSVWIAGRIVAVNGTTGSALTIESAATGLPGRNYRPDVGGWPQGSTGVFAVAYEHEAGTGNNDIHCKFLTANGTLTSNTPTIVSNDPANESNVSIGESCGIYQTWMAAFERTSPTPTPNQDIHVAAVTPGFAFPTARITFGTGTERRPSISSWADVPNATTGGSHCMVAYEVVTGSSSDIWVAVVDGSGTLSLVQNLSGLEGAATQGRNQVFPDVATDGLRFVVGYSENNGSSFDTYIDTIAWLPVTNALRFDEMRVPLSTSSGDELYTRMAARNDGNLQGGQRYLIACANTTTTTIPVFDYQGTLPGPNFTTRATQCGFLSITPSGNPTPNGTVSFTVANGPYSGTLFGFPATIPLQPLGCACTLGVAQMLVYGNPLVWTVPADPAFTGFALSVQGFTLIGNHCLTNFDLSDTIDFTIH